MAADDTKRLGYGGSAVVDGVQVLITSGGAQTGVTPSFQNPINIFPATKAGYTEISRSRVLHADGVEAYSASVGFDVTEAAMALFTTSRLFQRAYAPTASPRKGFTLGIYDGDGGKRIEDCYVTSLSLSGSVGGLVSCSLSVSSLDEAIDDSSITHDYILRTATQVPLGYWWSGRPDVRDWTLNFNQEVSPVYRNVNEMGPRYLRVGMIDLSLDVTTYEQLHQYDAVVIRTKTFTLTGVTSAEGYNYGGQTDLGTFTHSFQTAADATVGSDDPVLSIT